MLQILRHLVAVLVCVPAVVACASDSITVRSSLNARFVAVHISEAAKEGSIRTEIVGNPLAVSDAAWNDQIMSVLSSAHFGPEFAFEADAEVDSVTKTRIVVQFQPPDSTTVRTICSGVDTLEPSVESDSTRLEAIAALCVQTRALDWAIVTGPMPTSLDDAGLVRFTSAIARNIVRPNVRDGSGCDNSNCS